jgi:predicted RNA-binding protein with PIN domain
MFKVSSDRAALVALETWNLKLETDRPMPAPPTYLLIDGHSVIHAWPELRKEHRVASRRHLARTELLKRLRNLQDMTGVQVVAVFDGAKQGTNEEREPEGLQIIYADPGTTADTIIERLVAKYADERPMRVVSADGMVRETILSLGAEWISPEILRSMCDSAERDMRTRLA